MEPRHIALEHLKTIPYLDPGAMMNGRYLSNLSFFVKGEWHCWLPLGDRLQKMKMTPVEASYFGDSPERPTDQSFQLFHVTEQRASYPEMLRASRGIWNDFQNFATSLAKLKLFYETSKSKQIDTVRFVQTEVEYIVTVGRSVYDLLQEMIASHWDRIELFEKPKNKRQLPKSFADMIFHQNAPRTTEQIQERFGLPRIFADWYVAQGRFFAWLRSLRDRMAHGGTAAVQILYSTDRGYAIHRGEKPWCELYDWPKEVELPNELVPIRPLVCAIIWNVIEATESFAKVLERSIQLPAMLYPGLRFFSRGHYDHEFFELGDVLNKSLWCDSSVMTKADISQPLEPAVAENRSVNGSAAFDS